MPCCSAVEEAVRCVVRSDSCPVTLDTCWMVPAALSVDALRLELGALASEMMVDIALGERQVAGILGQLAV